MNLVKRLATINISFLLVFVMLFPTMAFAADEEQALEEDCLVASNKAVEVPADERIKGAQDTGAGLMDTDTYYISVNGTSFLNTSDASGTGWNYTASYNRLWLTDYTGSSIVASGDLVIYSSGYSSITGSSGTYGNDAITVDGCLDFYVFTGNVTLQGGSGSDYWGGDGIDTESLYLSNYGSTVTISGGYGKTYGGEGITGDVISLDKANNMNITGGAAYSGINAGYGIYFTYYLYVGLGTTTITAGSTSSYAVAVPSGSTTYFYLSPHITESAYYSPSNTLYRRTYTTNEYTLTVNGNGGTHNGLSNIYFTGKYPTYAYLVDYIFSRPGYKHIGWLSASGSDFYALDTHYAPTSNTLLYAEWAAVDDTTVLLVGNGGTINDEYYTSASTGVNITVPTRDQTINSDRYLLGWTKSYHQVMYDDIGVVYGAGVVYFPGQTVNFVNQTDLFAQWTYHNNIAYYHGNGGATASGSDLVVQAGSVSGSDIYLYVLDDCYYTRTGYTFSRWETANGTSYSGGNAIEMADPLTGLTIYDLYAQWSANTYTIEYYDGVINAGSSTHIYDTAKALNTSASLNMGKNGYTFMGWATTSSSATVEYADGQSVENLSAVSGDTIKLYAVWKADTYTINYNANGGSGAPPDQTVTNGAATLSSTIPVRSGYIFLGWSTSSTAASAMYLTGSSISLESNTTLYAVWQEDPYTDITIASEYEGAIFAAAAFSHTGQMTGICLGIVTDGKANVELPTDIYNAAEIVKVFVFNDHYSAYREAYIIQVN